jgi:hypothetical protein
MAEKIYLDVYFKIGDQHPGDGYKDGEPVYCKPVAGKDCFGQKRYIGPGDRKGYIIVRVLESEDKIKELFKLPRKNSNAYKRGRKTNYFIDLEKVFTTAAVAEYRDHDKEVHPIDILNLADLSDYRIDKKRLDKSFVHGSITDGTHPIGIDQEYSNLLLFVLDIANDIGSNTVIGEVRTNNSVGNNHVSLNTITDATGWVIIRSTSDYGGIDTPIIATDGDTKSFNMGHPGNYLVETIRVNYLNIESTPGSSSTRKTIIRRNIAESDNIDGNPISVYLSGGIKPTEVYDNVIYREVDDSVVGLNINANHNDLTTAYWDANIFIENNTVIYKGTGVNPVCIQVYSNNSGQTYTLRNNIMYCDDDSKNAIRNPYLQPDDATWKLINCARRGITDVADLVEQDCITAGITSADFLSIDIADDDFAKIDPTSDFYAVGVNDILEDNDLDIMGTPWPPAAPSIGAFSGYIPPPLDLDDYPEIYYNNHLAAATINSTNEDEDFPIENIAKEALWANWKAADTSDQTITADCGQSVTASRMLISGEFVDLTGVDILVEYSYNGTGWNTLAAWTQITAGPVLVRLPERTCRYWRIKLTSITTAPIIGHWGIYDPLIAPRQLGDGSDYYRARDLSSTHATENGKDQMHEGPQMREGRLLLGNMIYGDDNDLKVDELREEGRTGKIFICLAPETAPGDVFYALLENEIYNPVKGTTRSPRLDYREVT